MIESIIAAIDGATGGAIMPAVVAALPSLAEEAQAKPRVWTLVIKAAIASEIALSGPLGVGDLRPCQALPGWCLYRGADEVTEDGMTVTRTILLMREHVAAKYAALEG